ncbi:MAG: twin-arginine translocase subunit TatC [Ignavibacteriales bacterium]|nr:MAG: twin-arginine translocase subunit TatC [Ignavibacteriaceae bacterium]MBW7872278.1 twin-arginine translocase subunit TatC [Ignavibacteria bacterium]MCZ2142560.1 twin-arginine translocase subunit TatC [Ignavibacteriales bacterium]OQY79472.1 MAG: twin arginine-targeting protein translocase TatC [Ignavibacteriales bacterium UTCHB3]MBV6445575.1 Sec-independent protein translocase protein TatC [Ignavibacteriaceae bacterium]
MTSEEQAELKLIGKSPDENPEAEMSFWDHLEELRGRILKIFAGVIPIWFISIAFAQDVINYVLLYPAEQSGVKLQNIRPFGQLMLNFEVSFIVALIVTVPYSFYHLWQFVAPALHQHEKKAVLWAAFYSSFCFLLGTAFGYFLMIPMTLSFAAGFGSQEVVNMFTLDEYMSLIFSILLGTSLIFELPILSYLLTKIGLLSPKFMSKYRRHAIVILMIMAAFLSPGTDPFSMLILSVPLLLLYESSILISKWVQKNK